MIKDKFIEIKIKNLRQLSSLLKNGINGNVGEIVKIETEKLSKGSHQIITVICDNCGSEKEMTFIRYYNKTKGLTSPCYCGNKECINISRKISINKKYNVDNVFQLKEIKEKIKNTNMLLFGCENPQQNQQIKEKTENTNLLRYGFKNPFQNEEIKKKIKTTNNINHGVDYPQQSALIRSKYSSLHRSSKVELELLKFIEDNYSKEILKNRRNIIIGSEIDIYLPDLKLAFEFNGLYWHNEISKNKTYHLDKTNRCKEIGIELICIWEDQWEYSKNIIKSMVLNKLNIFLNTINLEETELKEIKDNIVISKFLNENDINGYIKCKFNIGLFHNNELVAIMLFKKNKLNNYELLKYCNKLNTLIVNGDKKIFNFFIQKYNPIEVISYTNRNFINYKLYNIGFKIESMLKPNCFYIVGKKRVNEKNYTQTDKKVYKIYDSGNIKLKYKVSLGVDHNIY